MIIFHEGMPRSGKSYAAIADHICPRIAQGRKVYLRLDGLNEDQYRNRLAEAATVTREELDQRCIYLSEEDVHRLDQLDIDNDSLIVLDELQNYWPAQKAALSPGMTKWVAEHGHHGLDVLCMGQLLKDCHRTWVNRTNRKLQFVKKDMLGKPDEYKWRMFTGSPDSRGNVKFVEVQQGDGTYDAKYFGCYKSHSDGTENKGTYEDERANIFKGAMFRKWLPMLGGAVLLAIGYMVYLFNGGLAPATAKPVKVTETITTSAEGQKTKVKELVNGKEVEEKKEPEPPKLAKGEKPIDSLDLPDVISELSKNNRIRLAYVLRSARHTRVIVEWRDTAFRVVEQMDSDDLEMLGWHVATTNNNRMAILASPEKRLIATAWPIDERVGEVSEEPKDKIRRQARIVRESSTDNEEPAPYERPLKETAPVSFSVVQADSKPSKWNY